MGVFTGGWVGGYARGGGEKSGRELMEDTGLALKNERVQRNGGSNGGGRAGGVSYSITYGQKAGLVNSGPTQERGRSY